MFLLVAASVSALLMNVMRISAMGLVGASHPALAEALHDLNAWIFTALAFCLTFLLSGRIGIGERRALLPPALDAADIGTVPTVRAMAYAPYRRLALLLGGTAVLGTFTSYRIARAGDWLPPVPLIIGFWSGHNAPLPRQSLAILGHPRTITRVYTNPFGEQVLVSVIAAGSFDAYHEPDVCMSGYGFRLTAEKRLSIAGPGSAGLRAGAAQQKGAAAPDVPLAAKP